MLRLGFIGCGLISGAHLDGLVELARAAPRFALDAVCDPERERAELAAANAAAGLGQRPRVFADHRALLDAGLVDVVTVMTPHDLHHVVAADAFAAGVHVQMLRPLAITPRFGRELLAAAARAGKTLTVSAPSVLGAANVALARAVHAGLIGQLQLLIDLAAAPAASGFLYDFYGEPWRHRKGRAGAGWLSDHGVDRAAQFLAVGGPVEQATGYAAAFEPLRRHEGATLRLSGEDTAALALRFASGALGHWLCSTAAHGEGAAGVWLYGRRGLIRPTQYARLDDDSQLDWPELVERYAPDVPASPFAHAYLELADAVEQGAPPIASAEQGLEALCVVFAALEAATVGRPVAVAEVRTGAATAYEASVIAEMERPGAAGEGADAP